MRAACQRISRRLDSIDNKKEGRSEDKKRSLSILLGARGTPD